MSYFAKGEVEWDVLFSHFDHVVGLMDYFEGRV
jgi:hypothetical protein